MLTNYGTFTLKDSSADKTGKIVNTQTYSHVLINAGTASMNGGTIESNVGNRAITNLGNLDINDGFTLKLSGGSWAGIQNGWDGDSFPSIAHPGTTVPILTINGGNFISEKSCPAIKNDDYGRLVVNGGTFNCNNYCIQNSGIIATINGGNFLNKDSQKGIILLAGGKNLENNIAELVINGGDFENESFVIYFNGCEEEDFDITVKGGIFSDEYVKKFVEEGIPVYEANGRIYVNTQPPANTAALTDDAPIFKYEVIEGKNQTWTKSTNEGLKYVLNADANNLVKVLIDGEEVDFEIDENGEVVISAEVLEKLEAGEYEIVFVFADGSCKTELYVK